MIMLNDTVAGKAAWTMPAVTDLDTESADIALSLAGNSDGIGGFNPTS